MDEEIKEEAEETAETEEENTEEEPKGEDEVLDDSKYEPEQRRPWNNKEERAEFFKGKQQKPEEEEGEEGDDEDKPLTRKDLKGIFNPILETLKTSADDSEINAFLARPENSHFKKYEKLARKDAKAYPNMPIGKIFKSLAHDDAMVAGAEKSQKAVEKNNKGKVLGSATRQLKSSVPDFSKMSMKEIGEFNQKLREGGKVQLAE